LGAYDREENGRSYRLFISNGGQSTADLVALKFIDGQIATFEDKDKNMSRYKLNMFPFQGEKPKHEYMLGSEWNKLRFRSWAPREKRLRVTVTAPEWDVLTFVKEHSDRPVESTT
jgi:hypothetical protein